MSLIWLWFILLCCYCYGGECRDVTLEVRLLVPKVVSAGSHATLVCQYDLKGASLYSVKWYRGYYEFYRYIPNQTPPALAFPKPGIYVDLAGSNAHQVTLRNVPKDLSGRFSCEVSADAPTFKTASDTSLLDVVEMNIQKPSLKLTTSIYKPGSNLHINCSVQETEPLAEVIFYVNDEKIDQRWVRRENGSVYSLLSQVLYNRVRQLKENQLGAVAPLWLRCEALVPGMYHLSSPSVPVIPVFESQGEGAQVNGSQISSKSRTLDFGSELFILYLFIIIL